jgi:hypothetical protein
MSNNNEVFETDETGFRPTDPSRIAYIKPTGLEEARSRASSPKESNFPKGRGSMCCMPSTVACSASPTHGTPLMARQCRTS